MGAGFFGVPLDSCAKIMIETISSHLQGSSKLEDVVICAHDRREYLPFESKMGAIN